MKREASQMTDEALQLLASVYPANPSVDRFTDEIIALIGDDPHEAGTRPCETCRKITARIGKPFWCLRVALSHDRL